MSFSGRGPQRNRRTLWIWCDRVWQNVTSCILLLMDNLEDAFITWNSGGTCRYHPYEIIGTLRLIILSVRVMGNTWADMKGTSLSAASLKEENIAGSLFQQLIVHFLWIVQTWVVRPGVRDLTLGGFLLKGVARYLRNYWSLSLIRL